MLLCGVFFLFFPSLLLRFSMPFLSALEQEVG